MKHAIRYAWHRLRVVTAVALTVCVSWLAAWWMVGAAN